MPWENSDVVFGRAAFLDTLLDLLHVALTASGGDADRRHERPFLRDEDVRLSARFAHQRRDTRISNQTEFPPNAMKEMHTQICARHHICRQTSQAKTTFSLLSASLSLFSPIYINKSLSPVLLPCDLLFRVAVLITDERLSFALSTSKALHGPLDTHCSSCDPLPLLRID